MPQSKFNSKPARRSAPGQLIPIDTQYSTTSRNGRTHPAHPALIAIKVNETPPLSKILSRFNPKLTSQLKTVQTYYKIYRYASGGTVKKMASFFSIY